MSEHLAPPAQMLWADTHRHRALCMVHPMKNLGIKVRVVDDGWSALREFKADPEGYAVAVVHVALTGIGSRDLSRQLRRVRAQMPMIFLGVPSWTLGPHEVALPLPLSPVQLHQTLVEVGAVGRGKMRKLGLTG